jgi:RNA polymerase sigma-70 factor (ECF subfamily)
MGYQEVIGAVDAFALGFGVSRSAGTPVAPVARSSAPARVPAVTDAIDPAEAERARLAALIAKMAAGEQGALADFYDATVSKSYGVALRVTGNAALAEEVVADTYHQAWRDAARYDRTRASPLTWLLMLCRSRALDALRARDPAVLAAEPEALIAEEDQGADENPLDLLCAIETHRALHAALATLSPAQRQMIALAFFRGLSHHEIAAQSKMPLGTVKSQIRRALVALKAPLAPPSGIG